MRKSLLLLGLILFALGHAAYADDPTLDTILQQGKYGCSASGQSGPDSTSGVMVTSGIMVANQAICGYQGHEYCRLASDTAGCDKLTPQQGDSSGDPSAGQAQKMPTTNYFENLGSGSTNVQPALQKAKEEADKLYSDAQAGCNNGDSQRQQDLNSTQNTGEGGVHGAANQTADLATKKMDLESKTAGVCRAHIDFCVNRLNKVQSDARQANQPAAADEIKKVSDNCAGLEPKERTLTTQAQKSGEEAEKAKEVVKKTTEPTTPDKKASGDPSTKPASDPSVTPQSKPTTAAKDNTSSGGMNPAAMAGMMQALQAMNQQQPQPTPTPPTEPQSMECGSSVVGGKCGASQPVATAEKAWPKGNGAGFDTQSKTGNDSFNPQSTSDSLVGSNLNQYGAGADKAKPSSAQPVANGGGQFLGGGSGGGGASLAQSGGGGYQTRPQQVSYNLGDAHGGGGYSQTAAGMNTAAGNTSGWSGYGREPASEGAIDLNQFLPGGKRDPNRGLAGLSAANMQIQSREVNIWSRISDHIRARCSQGLLRDCVP